MNNKIFFKITAIVVVIVLIYIFFITFFISPKISEYLVSAETKEAITQLDRVSTVIESKEKALNDFKRFKIEGHKKNIKNIGKIAYNIMQSNYQLFIDGKLSKEEAIKTSFQTISKMEYGFKNDYLFVLDKKGTLVFDPDKRYEGKNIYFSPDANGRLFIPDLIDNTIKNKSTYTTYSWSKLNSLFISEKITFSIYFEPFNLIISAGVYIENIKQELEIEKSKMLSSLEPLINSIVLGSKGYIFIVDSDDTILLHPNSDLVGKNVSGTIEPNTNKNMMDELRKAYNEQRPWNYKWNTALDKDNYIYDKTSWVKYNDFFKWYIVSSVYKDDLKTKSKEINKILLEISIILLLVLLVVSMFVIKRILSPIDQISKNMDSVKDGNLEIRNKIKTNDELGNLANHFDDMLDSIEENTKNLEQNIEDRTAEITHKLYYDELTGIKNRESLSLDLKKDDFLALSLIDIEQFDDINELYGFSVGNEILIKVKEILEEFSIKHDVTLYRLDSDIFGILDTDMTKITVYEKFLQDIQNVFKKEIHVDSLNIDLYIYVTMGISIAQTDSLKCATIALKKAKSIGLKYLVYNKEIDSKDNIKKTMYWREKIKIALERDLVIPFFQPIVNRKKEIIKYETLMRIYDEIDGKPYYLSPGSFFDVAIKTKQYFKLNQTVIKKAFENIEQIGHDISINIGFSDVLNIGFNEFIENEVNKLSLSQRKKVIFEVLESDHISDYDILDAFIFKFREKGIRIAIDDFGTGFSNFSHILKVQPDYIKIDGSLIKDIDKDDNSYQMVKSIVEFSKSLGITVIAEYIHSEEVYNIVQDLDIDEFQGYYLGEPRALIK